MNHYCTYFDRGFLAQGLALWRSLAGHDPDARLWVLALDDFTAGLVHELGDPRLGVVALAEMEAGDEALATAKANRTRVEYYFTLSPCWPRWLIAMHPEIERVTYVDADMFFFSNPAVIFSQMDAVGASVLVTAHRFPAWLRHYERHGKFNVGLLAFRNDPAGRACLDDWAARCLAWCHDRLERGKYADQKYLDAWPAQLGPALLVLDRPGMNLAPWNWAGGRWRVLFPTPGGTVQAPTLSAEVSGETIVLFHFARFRPLRGDWWWHSGQLEYGVMPRPLRCAIYGPYVRALLAARSEIAARRAGFDFPRRSIRLGREFWRVLPLRVVFGGDWLCVDGSLFNLRLGLGRWSGHVLALLRHLRKMSGNG